MAVARTFVALSDTVHGLLRSLTRQVPLCACTAPDGSPTVQYRVRVEDWPPAYHSLALYHSLQGWPIRSALSRRSRLPPHARLIIAERAGYFDAVRLDRRCCRDLRLKLARNEPWLFGAELLAYGTGTLRATNDHPDEDLHRYLWREHGRIHSRRAVTCARIVALSRGSLHWPGPAVKESYESTNLIYGDVLGEVEQLWERRADTVLLERVAQSLQGLRRRGEVAAFLSPPQNLDGLMSLHLRAQALWRNPPANARALLKRLDYILEHTSVDSSPQTVFRWRGTSTRTEVGAHGGQDWEMDDSGYDGWLSGRSQA